LQSGAAGTSVIGGRQIWQTV